MSPRHLVVCAIGLFFGAACSKTDAGSTSNVDSTPAGVDGAPPAAMTLTSNAFATGASIPVKYSCDGDDVSPPLAWSGAPVATKSFALIVDDPDAPGGTFTHWVLFDMPSATTTLGEGTTGVGVSGNNGFGAAKYGGPCPPKGKGLHHYSFRIHALDVATLGPKEGASRAEVDAALTGHVLAKGDLNGTFEH
jgi:Raf kinase inhibitor-like YbhB/YbcL family protein